MRITLPLGYPGTRPGTGLELASKVKGDFEITVNFEVLKEPDQVPAGGLATRVTLGVVLDMPERHEGSISWRIVGKGRYDFFTHRFAHTRRFRREWARDSAQVRLERVVASCGRDPRSGGHFDLGCFLLVEKI
jgi:hypothetical protein